jgi:prolyl-tRNA editing enzyme YbaK/EbsC (Cys-tRNA(Pro) deacylase)
MPFVAITSHQHPPSAEGRALALIDAMIVSFEAQNRSVRTEAFRALQIKDDSISFSSSHSKPTITTTRIISADNIDEIDIGNIDEVSSKTMEIVDVLQSKQCVSWRLQIVPKDFYDRDLEFRTKMLSASSSKSLCKSLLMRNSKCIRDDCNDPLNSKYYLVAFPYTKKLQQQKLKKFVKSLSKKSNKYYKFSLASMEETRALTRFEYNTVSPIGVGKVPVIISHHIVDLKQFWMGSGSLHIKLRIDTVEFLQKFPHFVADITS